LFERDGFSHAVRQATRRARPELIARAKPALEPELNMKFSDKLLAGGVRERQGGRHFRVDKMETVTPKLRKKFRGFRSFGAAPREEP
jgi:hypothetical protein